jgi:hypothetical protein
MEVPDFARRIIDFTRVLDGENRQSKDPEDARHWHAVYAELVGFKQKLLADTHQEIQRKPETESELGQHDVPFLEAEMKRLRGGLDFWASRLNRPDGSR